jgi:hypothetical protein
MICEPAAEHDVAVFAFPNAQSLSVYRKTGPMQRVGTCEVRLKVLSWAAPVINSRPHAAATAMTADLGPLLAPRSIAIVGASKTNPYASRLLVNLAEGGYQGRLYLINPRQASIDGVA